MPDFNISFKGNTATVTLNGKSYDFITYETNPTINDWIYQLGKLGERLAWELEHA